MDLKFALRSLRKNPGFALLAVLVMALGIGANTAMFTVVNAVLLKPLSYHEPDRIVTLSSLWRPSNKHGQVSAPDFQDWHNQSTAFSSMAYYAADETSVTVGSATDYGQAAEVTPEFLQVFDITPIVGHGFTAEDHQSDASTSVLISYSFWQSHFGGKTDALQRGVRMMGKTLNIVGVLPQGFHFPDKTDLWIPATTNNPYAQSRSGHNFRVVGRLKPGVTLEQAQAQMTAIGARLEKQYPESNSRKSVAVTIMRDEMVVNVRLTLYLMLGAVGLVLLIACANVANLLLAKATARSREMAIRAAVGASRLRIVKQLIIESLVLAVVSGLAGLILAIWGSAALVALAPANVPRLAEVGIDLPVLGFTLGMSIVASLLFGLAPAIHASRVDLNDALKQGAARAVVGGGAGRLRGVLVVSEVALSVVLLAGAGLLMKSFIALNNVSLGFRPEHVLIMETSVPAAGLAAARRATGVYTDLLPEIGRLPGVVDAGATRSTPNAAGSNGTYFIDHLPDRPDINGPQAVFSVVSPHAFSTFGIPLTRGRDFDDRDVYDAPFTAVINQALAAKSFPGEDPIGRTIYCGFDSMKPMKIVGVVGNVRQYGPAQPPQPELFMPYLQHPQPSTDLTIAVRTAAAPSTLADTLRHLVRQRAPEVPVRFSTMEAKLSQDVAAPRFRTLLLGIFAALAVALAMAGVYGVMAYAVGQRSNEIGLRMALGATPGDVQGLVLRQAFSLAGAGLVIGLLGAFAVTRLLSSMLFDVKPNDPLTYIGVAILLCAVSLAAGYLPARRAARMDPLVALRQE